MSLDVSVLASGSSGNATYVSSGRTRLLLDCGLVAKEIERRLAELGVDPRTLDGMLLTHAHLDHCRTAGTMQRRYGIPVYTHPQTDQRLRLRTYSGSYHRIIRAFPIPDTIGDIRISAVPVQHGGRGREAGRPLAFRLDSGGSSFGYATDIGRGTRFLAQTFSGVDGLLLETNFDEEIIRSKLADESYREDWGYLGWVYSPRGHQSNQQAAKHLVKLAGENTTDVFLGHISENHEDPDKDNNSFENAALVVKEALKTADRRDIRVRPTYRRGRYEGQATPLVTLG